MKKVITLTAMITLALSTVVEAKRGSGISAKPARSSTPAVQKQPTQTSTQSQQKTDADFNNTVPKQAANAPQAQQAQGNRLANFATGAMAGYLLGDMLSPNEAQAQEQTQATATQQAEPLKQLTEQVQQAAPAQVPTFKAIDPQDPFLIEKTPGYLRYCLNGVQYLISTANTQLPPTLMVDRTNAPAQCVIVK